MSEKIITAIISAISAIAVGYVPVWVARINVGKPPTPKQEITRLKRENERLKRKIKKMKGLK